MINTFHVFMNDVHVLVNKIQELKKIFMFSWTVFKNSWKIFIIFCHNKKNFFENSYTYYAVHDFIFFVLFWTLMNLLKVFLNSWIMFMFRTNILTGISGTIFYVFVFIFNILLWYFQKLCKFLGIIILIWNDKVKRKISNFNLKKYLK